MTRYWDYNPSYSHPGMPASTPTSFYNFVRPRPPSVNWPQAQSEFNRVPPRRESVRPDRVSSRSTSRSYQFGDPFTMMGMTDPSTWSESSGFRQNFLGRSQPGMNQPSPYPMNQPSQGPPRQIRIQPQSQPSSNINSFSQPEQQPGMWDFMEDAAFWLRNLNRALY